MPFDPLRPEDGKPFGAARLIELQERLAAYVDAEVSNRATYLQLDAVRSEAAVAASTAAALAARPTTATVTAAIAALRGEMIAALDGLGQDVASRASAAALEAEAQTREEADANLLQAILVPLRLGEVDGLSAGELDALPTFPTPPTDGVVASAVLGGRPVLLWRDGGDWNVLERTAVIPRGA